MTTKEFFDFIVDPTIQENQIKPYLEKLKETIKNRKNFTNEEMIEEEVFKNVYIPRR